MTESPLKISGGVDTHSDTNHAAVIDTNGRQLGDAKFPITPQGYTALIAFLKAFGEIVKVGVEGSGSYGAALTRHLQRYGIEVVEVIRPNRQLRRMHGKSDPLDAYAAAATALSAHNSATPKVTTGTTEAIRCLLVARRSAVKTRSAAIVQIKLLLVTAPEERRERFRNLSDKHLIESLSRVHPNPSAPVQHSFLTALRSLARRYKQQNTEICDLEEVLEPLVRDTNPGLLAAKGVGVVVAAQLPITAGDNPERLRSEASFAAITGVSLIPASSGKTSQHRLNRGGDRQANSAIHRIALVRMSSDPRTKTSIAKKRAQGKTKKSAIRSLKRAIARVVFTLLTKNVEIPQINDLRPLRQTKKISLTTAAQ